MSVNVPSCGLQNINVHGTTRYHVKSRLIKHRPHIPKPSRRDGIDCSLLEKPTELDRELCAILVVNLCSEVSSISLKLVSFPS